MQQATTQETLVEALRLLQRLEPEKTAAIDNLLLAIQHKFVSSRIHEVVCLVQATMKVFRYPTFLLFHPSPFFSPVHVFFFIDIYATRAVILCRSSTVMERDCEKAQ